MKTEIKIFLRTVGHLLMVMLVSLGIGVSLAVIFSIVSPKSFAQLGPNDPDTPFIPYSHFHHVHHEWGVVLVSDEEEVWTGSLDNPYDISVLPCPFIMELQDELEHFEAHCEGVFMNDEGIAIPPNCKARFKVRNHKEGVLIHRFCPVLLKLYRLEEEAI